MRILVIPLLLVSFLLVPAELTVSGQGAITGASANPFPSRGASLAPAPVGPDAVTVGGPTQVHDPSYPLKVRIVERSASRTGDAVRTWGRADLYDGQKAQGFDYQADCNMVFMVSEGDERFSARWKKQDKELEILVSKMGTGKSSKCVVKVDLQPFSYEFEGRTIVTKPLAN